MVNAGTSSSAGLLEEVPALTEAAHASSEALSGSGVPTKAEVTVEALDGRQAGLLRALLARVPVAAELVVRAPGWTPPGSGRVAAPAPV